MVAFTCSPSTWRLGWEDGFHEFKTSLDSIVRPHLKSNNNKQAKQFKIRMSGDFNLWEDGINMLSCILLIKYN
jgi:hypothetical protein